ncbi:CotH kinase family protein [Paenibacillus sp. FSL R5-0636]|uniref:CotH kinase family protein n=1 Tax=Paenibacillus TaxID=44249 RepID=UPI0004F68592|nr:CotH kinase family protein [Paenibacillus odorifer]AIQ73804.1 spore coat protein CotH [Paenibacillus odorifer]OMC95471.1 spore coat protein CotH [Paenibacillus odorifer]OMC99884.1 spore coat protein CotH [Paenibacillus odorifer]
MKTRGKSILLSFCCLLLVIAVAGCQNASPSATNNPTSDAQDKVISSDEKKLDEQVFPKDKVVDVKITLDPDDFQDMLDNASAEEYKMASVEYNGMKYDNVAVRTKGNLSLRSVVQMTDSDRYSFKISFDEYVNQNLFGITKINLNNNYSDASYMREFLTYELAESVGLPTPKYSFVNVYVNDELKGFYLAVEQIGDAYLERNFGNTYGALYKGIMTGQGSDLTWLGDDPALYTGLEMKSDKSNDDILVDMLNELNNGTDYEKYIDVEESLKYIALNAVTGNMDSYLGGNKQNYYLYEDDGVFSILPWDYNMAFGGMGSADVLIDEPTQGALAERPLIAKLLANEEYKTKYHEIVSEMITGYLADDTFQARIDELNTMISSYVKADPSAFYTFEQYENGIKAVETFMSNMATSIQQQLDGTIPSSGDGSGSGGGMGGGMGGGGFGGGAKNGAAQGAAGAGQATGADGATGNTGANAAAANTGGQAATDGQTAQGGAGGEPGAMGGPAVPNAGDGPGSNSQATAGGQTTQTGQTAQDGQNNTNGQAAQGGFDGGAGGEPGAMGGPAFPEGGGNGPGGGGMGGGGFGGGMPGGMGGGDFGGAGTMQQKGSTSEAITTGVAILLLILTAAFVTYYKRKRL